MARRNYEKITGLIIGIIIIAVSVLYSPAWDKVGISTHCSILQRIIYPLFHASAIHAVANVWCFISVIFIFNISFNYMLTAYLIAVVAPDIVLLSLPTVGLSAVCFALFGIVAFKVKQKLYFNTCMAVYIASGFILPSINGSLHLYSYIVGLLVGLLNMPIQCKTK